MWPKNAQRSCVTAPIARSVFKTTDRRNRAMIVALIYTATTFLCLGITTVLIMAGRRRHATSTDWGAEW